LEADWVTHVEIRMVIVVFEAGPTQVSKGAREHCNPPVESLPGSEIAIVL
jgi:hypothetical protein